MSYKGVQKNFQKILKILERQDLRVGKLGVARLIESENEA